MHEGDLRARVDCAVRRQDAPDWTGSERMFDEGEAAVTTIVWTLRPWESDRTSRGSAQGRTWNITYCGVWLAAFVDKFGRRLPYDPIGVGRGGS